MVGNIFHLAAWTHKEKFFQEAIRMLPDPLVHTLLCQPDQTNKWNPLHVAAKNGNLGIVKLILEFYRSKTKLNDEYTTKPWLALNVHLKTPLHVLPSYRYGCEECALEIIMFVEDMEAFLNMVDDDGNSILFLAVQNGYNRLALKILTSGVSYSASGSDHRTPLHFVTKTSEEVCTLLLERHIEFMKAIDYKVLHKWIKNGKIWALEYVSKRWESIAIASELKQHLMDLMCTTNFHGQNSFYIAAEWKRFEASRILANIYREVRAKTEDNDRYSTLPWLELDGRTPLDIAISEHKAADEEFNRLKTEIIDMKPIREGKRELLFLAIQKGLFQAADGLWDIQLKYGFCVYPPQGRELLRAALIFSEEVAIWLAQKLPSMTSQREDIIYTLELVSKLGTSQFLEWMLKENPSALKEARNVWVEACVRGHLSTVMAFIDNSPCFRETCLEIKDTPLHYIKLDGYHQYEKLLENPVMVKLTNFQDSNGDTPLHKAIKTRNLLLTEVLLSRDNVIRGIKNKENKTAMELLVQECRDPEWDEMCKRNGIIPGLKMTYFQDKANVLEIRNTLSVVAALLATITFTAGFTLPGGVKSDSTGKATLANKEAFIVFLLADALGMCFSMLVLVRLMWSMVCDQNKSLFLIDQSMTLLLCALYSTLLAFMTGVYVVIPHKHLWVAILILIMCSCIMIVSIRDTAYILINKFYHDMLRTYRGETPLRLEQRETSTNEAPPEVPQQPEVFVEMKPLLSRDQGETNEASTSGGNSLSKNDSEPISTV